MLAVNSDHVVQSYGFTLRATGYRVTRATLSSANGAPTGNRPGQGPCAAQGASVICHALPYKTGSRQGLKTFTITFRTDPCYPAGAGLSRGISGPSTPCQG